MAFVGRERELAQLAGALQRAASGRQSRVVVTGPAGIGLTRLVDELVARVVDVKAVIVARGCAIETAAGEPYQAVVEALGTALAALPDGRLRRVVDRAGHDLATLLPELTARFDQLGIQRGAPVLVAPGELGSRVVEALLGFLEHLAADDVLLLILEDLHAADPATRAFLGTMLRLGRPARLCLVMTYRPSELHRKHPATALAEMLEADSDGEHIRLEPLATGDLERLVEALRGERASGDLMAAVAEGSGGNPLLVTQLVAAAGELEGVRLSDPLEQLVGARLDGLSATAAGLVRLLAAARQPIDRSAALRTRLPEGRLTVAAVTEAVQSGLIRLAGEQVVISHELYAEAIEELELPAERLASHALVARLLEARPARAAWHWEVASQPAEARRAHLQAAAVTGAIDPGETTLLHLLRVLELRTDLAPARTEAVQLLVAAARAAAASGSFRRAGGLLRRAIDAAVGEGRREDGARLALGELHEELGRILWAGGDLDGGVAAMQHALDLMPPGPSRARARALASLAQHLMLDGRFAESVPLAEQAREAASSAGPVALAELSHATCTLGVDVAYLGRLDDGLRLLQEAATTARRAGRLDDLMRAALNRTTLLDLDARREEALEVVTESLRDAAAGGLAGTYGSFLRANAADILFQLGRWEESERECRAGMEWPPAGVAWYVPTVGLGLLLVESRADEEAARLVGQTILQLQTVPAGQWTVRVQRAAVSLALWHGQHRDAVTMAARAWPQVLATDEAEQVALAASTCLEAAAEAVEWARERRDVALVAQANELAAGVLPEAQRRLARSSLPPDLGARLEAQLHLATAHAHRARMRGHAQAGEWGRLADAWMARSIPYLAAKARWWQALAVLRAGDDREQARAAIQEAWRIATALPARPLQAALVDLAARARLPLGGDDATRAVPTPVVRSLVAMGPGPVAAEDAPVAAGSMPTVGTTVLGGSIGDRLLDRPGAEAVDTFGLSPREMEVLRVICEGRTDREIADHLFISERTVHVHVRNILSKMSVSSRTQAASVALRGGLVPLASGHGTPAGTPT